MTTYAARTMAWSGPIVGLYIIYHLLHLTAGYQAGFDPQNPYNNVVHGFQNWIIATVYVTANVLLGLHLFHGAWSWLQSLGLSHPRYDRLRKQAATGLAVALAAGFVSIPTAVMLQIVEPVDEAWFHARYCAPELAHAEGDCDYLNGGGEGDQDDAAPGPGPAPAPAPGPPPAPAAPEAP